MLANRLQDFFVRNGAGKTYWVAFSGGLDSSVLLALCHELRSVMPLQLNAIHINHDINPNADAWVSFCQEVCASYHIPLVIKKIQIDANAVDGFEQQARDKRYQAIADSLQPNDILLTAHHQDDQAETFLLQLLRGAGTKGLSAMPIIKPYLHAMHARPLLSARREELKQYASVQQLKWIEDDSNQDQRFARNYIRHSVMPVLSAKFPAAVSAIVRSREHIAESEHLLNEYALVLLPKVLGRTTNTLCVSALQACTPSQQHLLLRTWIRSFALRAPSTQKLQALTNNLLFAANDRFPRVAIDAEYEVRRFRDELYLLKTSSLKQPQLQPSAWNLHQTLDLPGIGKLIALKQKGVGLAEQSQRLSVQFRVGGEKVSLNTQHRTLKNLFQEWGVPIWLRNAIPLIYSGERLVCVVGYFVDERYQAKGEEMGWLPHLEPV